MATLDVTDIARTGVELSGSAAASGGDQFTNTGSEFVAVTNGQGDALVVTITTPNTVDDLAIADRTVTIGAGETYLIGPFSRANYNDSSGYVQLSYDDETSVTVQVFRLTRV
jgi:hypothetical protein